MKGEGWTVQSKEQTTIITNPESNPQAPPPVQWKGRASSLRGRARSLVEQGAWQSKELGRARSLAEQGAWQSKELGHCRAGQIPSLEASLGLCNPTYPRAQELAGKTPSLEASFGLCKPTYPRAQESAGKTPSLEASFGLCNPPYPRATYPVFCGFCGDIVWLRAYFIFDIV